MQIAPRRIPRQRPLSSSIFAVTRATTREDLFFRVIDVQVDIHTGHDISGTGPTSSAGAAAVDVNNLVDQTSPGCISLHQVHFLLSILPSSLRLPLHGLPGSFDAGASAIISSIVEVPSCQTLVVLLLLSVFLGHHSHALRSLSSLSL